MKKPILSVAVLACIAVLTVPAMGQNAQPAAKSQLKPAVIGLVDMAKVFKEYKKFEDMRQGLTTEMQGKQAEGQAKAKAANKIKEELKLLQAGSPDYLRRESDLVKLTTELQAMAQVAKNHLARREAEIFEGVYRDAIKVVKLYAEHFGYTMIIRFNSEPLTGDNPQKLATGLNKLVVYSRPQDDITEAVIDYLNRQYKPDTPVQPRTATQPGGPARQ